MLDERIRPFAGMDVIDCACEDINKQLKRRDWRRWERYLMCFRPCPYICTRGFGWSEEIIRGDPRGVGNVLGWNKVVLNMPGTSSCDLSMPWIYKQNTTTGKIAGDITTFVDDVIPTDFSALRNSVTTYVQPSTSKISTKLKSLLSNPTQLLPSPCHQNTIYHLQIYRKLHRKSAVHTGIVFRKYY